MACARAAPPRRPADRPSRPSRRRCPGPRRDAAAALRPRLLDGVQRREGRRGGRRTRPPGRATCSRCWPASGRGRHLLPRPRRRLPGRARSPPSPTGSTRSRAAASPASPPSRRCSSIRRLARSARPRTSRRWSRAAEALAKAGRSDIEINAPGTTSQRVLAALAEAGATQVEPGNGLHGTTALHALEDLPELPAVALPHRGLAPPRRRAPTASAAGFYIDPIFPDYDVKAIVSREPTTAATALRSVEIPPPSAIDYYAHDRRQRQRRARGRRHRGVRLPRPGLRHPRLRRRHLRPVGGPAAGRGAIENAFGARPSGHERGGGGDGTGRTGPRASRGIRKTFGGVVAIENFSLDVARGEIVALVGDNGAGKSTLVKIISGVHPPTAGDIALDGEDVTISTDASQRQATASRWSTRTWRSPTARPST